VRENAVKLIKEHSEGAGSGGPEGKKREKNQSDSAAKDLTFVRAQGGPEKKETWQKLSETDKKSKL